MIAVWLAAGCSGPSDGARTPLRTTEPRTKPLPLPRPLPRVTARPANRMGKVLIVEYHHISPKEARWDRSIRAFRADLERLYRMGFRPVTLSQFLDGRMPLPPGASPVVFTFDDASPSQIRLREDSSLDPDCAMGKAFSRKAPRLPPECELLRPPHDVGASPS